MLPNSSDLDPRVRRTRQLIVDAFTALLSEKGFAALTVQDVTSRAQINRATFYAHFPDKYALLEHAMGWGFRNELEKRVLNACHFSLDNLQVLIATVCDFLQRLHKHCGTHDPQFQALVEAQVREQVYGLVLHWIESLEAQPQNQISRERAATAASWTIYGLAMAWVSEKRATPVEQFTQEVLPLVAVNLGQAILMPA